MNVDANVIFQNLTKRISQLEFDIAIKDAQISALEAELSSNKDNKKEPSEK